MTFKQFENGYWFVDELVRFAKTIGVPDANKLRKDELEKAIIRFLRTGEMEKPTKRNLSKSGVRDVEKGLSLDLRVVNYTSNHETKEFIVREAQKIVPQLRRKSGARYRLNRWREEQLTAGNNITYRDLVMEYIRLNQTEDAFARIPHGRYINFVADFLASEPNATRERAIKAWEQLKKLDMPKTYRAWANFHSSKNTKK